MSTANNVQQDFQEVVAHHIKVDARRRRADEIKEARRQRVVALSDETEHDRQEEVKGENHKTPVNKAAPSGKKRKRLRRISESETEDSQDDEDDDVVEIPMFTKSSESKSNKVASSVNSLLPSLPSSSVRLVLPVSLVPSSGLTVLTKKPQHSSILSSLSPPNRSLSNNNTVSPLSIDDGNKRRKHSTSSSVSTPPPPPSPPPPLLPSSPIYGEGKRGGLLVTANTSSTSSGGGNGVNTHKDRTVNDDGTGTTADHSMGEKKHKDGNVEKKSNSTSSGTAKEQKHVHVPQRALEYLDKKIQESQKQTDELTPMLNAIQTETQQLELKLTEEMERSSPPVSSLSLSLLQQELKLARTAFMHLVASTAQHIRSHLILKAEYKILKCHADGLDIKEAQHLLEVFLLSFFFHFLSLVFFSLRKKKHFFFFFEGSSSTEINNNTNAPTRTEGGNTHHTPRSEPPRRTPPSSSSSTPPEKKMASLPRTEDDGLAKHVEKPHDPTDASTGI